MEVVASGGTRVYQRQRGVQRVCWEGNLPRLGDRQDLLPGLYGHPRVSGTRRQMPIGDPRHGSQPTTRRHKQELHPHRPLDIGRNVRRDAGPDEGLPEGLQAGTGAVFPLAKLHEGLDGPMPDMAWGHESAVQATHAPHDMRRSHHGGDLLRRFHPVLEGDDIDLLSAPLMIPLVYCHINSFRRASSVEKPWPGGEKRRGGRASHHEEL